MKTYRKYIDVQYYLTIAMLIKCYREYEIKYSDDKSTAFIGECYLKKQLVKDVSFSQYSFDRGYEKMYNSYHIGFDDPRKKNETITYDNNPLLFAVIDRLDSNCYKEYTKRQKREQLITSIKSFPGQIAKKLGWQK